LAAISRVEYSRPGSADRSMERSLASAARDLMSLAFGISSRGPEGEPEYDDEGGHEDAEFEVVHRRPLDLKDRMILLFSRSRRSSRLRTPASRTAHATRNPSPKQMRDMMSPLPGASSIIRARPPCVCGAGRRRPRRSIVWRVRGRFPRRWKGRRGAGCRGSGGWFPP